MYSLFILANVHYDACSPRLFSCSLFLTLCNQVYLTRTATVRRVDTLVFVTVVATDCACDKKKGYSTVLVIFARQDYRSCYGLVHYAGLYLGNVIVMFSYCWYSLDRRLGELLGMGRSSRCQRSRLSAQALVRRASLYTTSQ